MSDIHSCSYYCDRPACIKAQRDELRDKFQVMQAQAEIDAKAQRIAALQHSGEPVAWQFYQDGEWYMGMPGFHRANTIVAGFATRDLYTAQQAVVPEGFSLIANEILDRFPEINSSNYSHDDVDRLNAWGIELVLSAVTETV